MTQSRRYNLFDLPTDITTRIPYAAPLNEAISLAVNLSSASKQSYQLFRPAIQPEIDQRAANLLLKYVLQRKVTQAKAMFKLSPKLLFIEGIANDYAAGFDQNNITVHRVVIASPYKAALGAGDLWMLEQMAVHFNQVTNGLEIAKKQLKEQFPHGFSYPKSTYDFTDLVNTIKRDRDLATTHIPSAATESTLKRFRNDFMPSIVNVGHHFNLNDLIAAYKIGKNTCWETNCYDWGKNKFSIFWVQVINYLNRMLSAAHAQEWIANSDFKLRCTMDSPCKNNNIFYFPLDQNPSFRLGHDFGVYATDSYQGTALVDGLYLPPKFLNQCPLFHSSYNVIKKVAKKTVAGLEAFEKQLDNPQSRIVLSQEFSSCVIS